MKMNHNYILMFCIFALLLICFLSVKNAIDTGQRLSGEAVEEQVEAVESVQDTALFEQ
ncbi:MAG: hypothetical protein IJ196_08770 [Prevotella sp.]|nr:hypothetical protein [Prevotella sp.]